jgi:hypothetical protein
MHKQHNKRPDESLRYIPPAAFAEIQAIAAGHAPAGESRIEIDAFCMLAASIIGEMRTIETQQRQRQGKKRQRRKRAA